MANAEGFCDCLRQSRTWMCRVGNALKRAHQLLPSAAAAPSDSTRLQLAPNNICLGKETNRCRRLGQKHSRGMPLEGQMALELLYVSVSSLPCRLLECQILHSHCAADIFLHKFHCNHQKPSAKSSWARQCRAMSQKIQATSVLEE